MRPATGNPDETLSSTVWSTGVGTSPIFTREWSCPQPVANLGTTFDAFFKLAGLNHP